MILVFPLALAITVVVLWRARGKSGSDGRGCRWFWAWTAVGAALCFSFLTGFTIGLFVLPFALLSLCVVLRGSPRLAESIGLLEGIGLTLLLVAYVNRSSSGGVDPHPWLLTGLAVTGFAALGYAMAHRSSK